MSIKKMLLLASMALAAIAFAAPATASAYQFGHEGSPVTKGTEVELEGTAGFENPSTGVGVVCPVTVVMTASTASTGSTTFDILNRTKECKFTGPFTSNCSVVAHEQVGSWEWHVTGAKTVTITDITFKGTNTGSFCPIPKVNIIAEATATVDNAAGITTVTIAGKGTNEGSSVDVFGHFAAVDPETYEIIQ